MYIFNVRVGADNRWTVLGRIDFEIIPRKNILNSHFDFVFLAKTALGLIRKGRIISWGCFNHKTSKILVNLSNAFWLIATIPRGIHRSAGLLSIFYLFASLNCVSRYSRSPQNFYYRLILISTGPWLVNHGWSWIMLSPVMPKVWKSLSVFEETQFYDHFEIINVNESDNTRKSCL